MMWPLQVLIGLRAIGNAGHVSSVASVLNKCLNRNKNPMEVRVAAAQAFRRMPCDANVSPAVLLLGLAESVKWWDGSERSEGIV